MYYYFQVQVYISGPCPILNAFFQSIGHQCAKTLLTSAVSKRLRKKERKKVKSQLRQILNCLCCDLNIGHTLWHVDVTQTFRPILAVVIFLRLLEYPRVWVKWGSTSYFTKGVNEEKIPLTVNTWPSRTCAFQEYRFYTMSPKTKLWLFSIPWVNVYTMIPCLYHKSMSVPWVLSNNKSICPYHESRNWSCINTKENFHTNNREFVYRNPILENYRNT